MAFFPMYFNLSGKKILVVGGGAIAAEKLEKLLDFTDVITIIAKEVNKEVETYIRDHGLVFYQKAYRIGDIQGFDIVIVATDTIELHREIYEESRQSRILVNSVDDTAYCDFIFPSYVKRGDLTISISTGGASPAFAKQLREYLQNKIPESVEDFLQKMKDLRSVLPKGKERMRKFDEMAKDFMDKHFRS